MHIFIINVVFFNCAFARTININPEVVFIPPEERMSLKATDHYHQPHQQQPDTRYYYYKEPQYQQHLPNHQYHVQDVYGQYSYGYKTADGMEKQEIRKSDGTVVGSYLYISPEGKRVVVNYTAGKDGYRASSDVIPQPVEPTPEVVEATRNHLAGLAAARRISEYDSDRYVTPENYDAVAYNVHAAETYNVHGSEPYNVHDAVPYTTHNALPYNVYNAVPYGYSYPVQYSFGYEDNFNKKIKDKFTHDY